MGGALALVALVGAGWSSAICNAQTPNAAVPVVHLGPGLLGPRPGGLGLDPVTLWLDSPRLYLCGRLANWEKAGPRQRHHARQSWKLPLNRPQIQPVARQGETRPIRCPHRANLRRCPGPYKHLWQGAGRRRSTGLGTSPNKRDGGRYRRPPSVPSGQREAGGPDGPP